MSAPLKLDSEDLRYLGKFLDGVSVASNSTGVHLVYHITVEIQGVALAVTWDGDRDEYVIDDVVGG